MRRRHFTSQEGFVFPNIGRAGLGNELFPWLRAYELSRKSGSELLPPRWLQLRVGPVLRREHDKRQYWRLFRRPTARQLLLRSVSRVLPNSLGAVQISGMDGFFEALNTQPETHRAFLERQARPGVIRETPDRPHVSVHVRLGDFARPSENSSALTSDNTAAPIDWYVATVLNIKELFPATDVIVSSDGTIEELSPLLDIPGVTRSKAANALDEIFLLARAVGLVGSRSTFTAWGAYLGTVPLYLPVGGNAYSPHDLVWEGRPEGLDGQWSRNVASRLADWKQ